MPRTRSSGQRKLVDVTNTQPSTRHKDKVHIARLSLDLLPCIASFLRSPPGDMVALSRTAGWVRDAIQADVDEERERAAQPVLDAWLQAWCRGRGEPPPGPSAARRRAPSSASAARAAAT